MASVSVSQAYDASAAAVWDVVGDLNISSWHPAITASPVADDGNGRTCTLADGGEVVEEILERDDAARRYRYRVVTSPLPMTDYVSAISVRETERGSQVTWEAEFTPVGIEAADLEGMIRGLYEAGLGALTQKLER